ncbi:hypothetical protein [Speluncibacter jeojiensis]|uniref:Heavy metal-binding domain-containing protein n=1 Tax=Speluncibacter jeojiensis TaxID=2710754 RepID=A0A9X4RD03_9ACTN|nr:hypothetical protein [Rhodococcus sp. D2-41]MDG3014089.1 hypothetical protein [Corynebacteriales bacterium D3-21]
MTTAHAAHHHAAALVPGGLQVAEQGYALSEITAPATANEPGALSFRILDAAGVPVTAFDEQHEKELHLIVVRTDTSGFRHVHPVLADDGTWSIDWTWAHAGSYRVFADIHPTGGPALTLTRTVDVAGALEPTPLPAPSRTTEVDGYRVALAGDLATAGGPLTLSVSRDGRPVTDLQPYLGAYGHLVALRAGDLAYLHVHPQGEPGDGVTPAGPDITFHAQAPSVGTYRLFLDFQHENTVRTAEFTVAVGGAPEHADHAPHVGHDHLGAHAGHGAHHH